MKMLTNLSEKHRAKFPATTLSYSMVKIALLNNAFSESFELETSPVEGQSLPEKDTCKKRRKRKGKKKLNKPEKPKDIGHFLVQESPNFNLSKCQSKNVIKKGMLPCCKCLFE